MQIMGQRPATLAWVLAAAALLGAGSASAQLPDKYKNLQVLPKDISKADLVESMKQLTNALGVRCTYCHVGEEKAGVPPFQDFKFDSDDKAPKVTARAMMKMTADINSKYLAEIKTGRDRKLQVSCMTCHHAVAIPQTIGEILMDVVADKGGAAAEQKYRELRKQYEGRAAYDFGEFVLHDVIRTLANKGRVDDALVLEKMNVEFHPDSSRAFFTLGELYAGKDDKAAAADAYRKAIAISPDNEQAKKRLAEVTKAGS
ncbi:MAG TPA: c-type cytochrome [Verrucomicrobiae bacterium]|nr:c-type cytochrome [Verrucomicrobiae bacterium]